MITALIICLTIIFCVTLFILWATYMSMNQLPMFTFGECVQKEAPVEETPNPIGFAPEEDTKTKEQTAKEQKDALLADPVTMIASLLRGEVDIDELTRN
jgi:hypothetical protein